MKLKTFITASKCGYFNVVFPLQAAASIGEISADTCSTLSYRLQIKQFPIKQYNPRQDEFPDKQKWRPRVKSTTMASSLHPRVQRRTQKRNFCFPTIHLLGSWVSSVEIRILHAGRHQLQVQTKNIRSYLLSTTGAHFAFNKLQT